MLAAKLNNTHSADIGFFWSKSVKARMIASRCKSTFVLAGTPDYARIFTYIY